MTKAPDLPPRTPPPRKPCPTCGKPIATRQQRDGQFVPYCPACDGPDPLRSPKALNWAKGSLRPPTRLQ